MLPCRTKMIVEIGQHYGNMYSTALGEQTAHMLSTKPDDVVREQYKVLLRHRKDLDALNSRVDSRENA